MPRIDHRVHEEIDRIVKNGYPYEVCGFLIGNPDLQKVTRIIPTQNMNTTRAEDRFEIDPDEFRRVDRQVRVEKLEILGFYHSHPDHPPRPSETDRLHSWPGYFYIIVAVEKGLQTEFRCWTFNEERDFEEERIETVRE